MCQNCGNDFFAYEMKCKDFVNKGIFLWMVVGYAKRETLCFTLYIFTCFFIVCYQVNMSKPCYHGNSC